MTCQEQLSVELKCQVRTVFRSFLLHVSCNVTRLHAQIHPPHPSLTTCPHTHALTHTRAHTHTHTHTHLCSGLTRSCRTPRASNEARQQVSSLPSGEQMRVGLKTPDVGRNAIIRCVHILQLVCAMSSHIFSVPDPCTGRVQYQEDCMYWYVLVAL